MKPENFPVNSNPRFTENLKRGFFYKELSCDDIFHARRERNASVRAICGGVFSKLLATVSGEYQAGDCAVSNQQSSTAGFTTEGGWRVHSPTLVIDVPKHIRLTITSNERMWKVPPVNRREVLRRDHHSCQYCGSGKHLTLDHVMPRSKGGSHTWDNVVTACERCNSRKGDRTLFEAGMQLRTKPKAPMHPAISFAEQFWIDMQANLE